MNTAPTFPMVPEAGEAYFPAGSRASYPCVESRLVLVCRGGSGLVIVDGTEVGVAGGDVLVLPWGAAVSYLADDRDPYRMSFAHLIPRHDADAPVEPGTAHSPAHPLSGCAWRNDDATLLPGGLTVALHRDHFDLVDLVDYIARVFQVRDPVADLARAMGTLLAFELASGPRSRPPRLANLPVELQRVVAFVDERLDSPITLASMAAAAGYSEATLHRRFDRHLGSSPKSWLTERRLRRAANLLRHTQQSIAEVARAIGIPDPFYFSRLFRQQFGEPPSSWRRVHRVR
jgi:AraC-like DNA-binding protein